jgi:hypothetical protein
MKHAKTLLAGVIISSVLAQGGLAQIIADFESYTTPTANGTAMFRAPSFSGSTGTKLDPSPNSSTVESTGIPLGNPLVGNNALLVSFSFNDTNPVPLWVRLTTFNTQDQPNPTIGLSTGMGLQFDIHSDTPLFVTALVRETETGAAFGANGGSANGIEFVGGNPTTTTGKAVAANTWTTLLFDFSTDPVAAFAGATANGILEPGVDGKGVLEALGLAVASGTTGDINIWLDNFQVVPEPSTVALSVLGGLGLFFAVRRHRKA